MSSRAGIEARSSEQGAEWTPARLFLATSALYHLVLGVLGFAVDQTFPLNPEAAASAQPGFIFGVFETNGWHSLAALLLGVISLYFTVRPLHARAAALAIGVSQAVTVAALAVQDPSTFLLASNAADQVVHSATAVGGIAAGLMTPNGRRVVTPAPG